MKKLVLTFITIFVVLLSFVGCNNTEHVHEYVAHDYKEPSCVEQGHDAYYSCKTCDLLFDSNLNIINEVPTLTINHDYLYHGLVVPTEDKNGNYEYYTCKNCNKIFNVDKEEVDYKDVIISSDVIVTRIEYIDKGNIYFTTDATEFYDRTAFMNKFSYGDILNIRINNLSIDMPLVSNYSDCDNGVACLVGRSKNNYLCLAVPGGSFAEEYDIAYKDENDNWIYNDEYKNTYAFCTLKESAGYLGEYLVRQLSFTDNREDYSILSDSEFANFRPLSGGSIAANRIYRSSSPIDPSLKRDQISLNLSINSGINVFINLCDDVEEMFEYGNSNDTSYYYSQKILNVKIDNYYKSQRFNDTMKEIISYMAKNDGVYLIHCKEGKDRAGVVCALIELLMGADEESYIKDYMISCYNYYGVTSESVQYQFLANNFKSSIDDILDGKTAFEYFNSIGCTENEISTVRSNLEKTNN